MIGLNTSIFKSAGRKLVNLLGALKDRAAYYENGTDSTAEKNHIDDLGVLDKATILLTPTATSDARVHSVKTYTGDELVTNGDFSTSDLSSFGSIYANMAIENERLKVSPSAGQGYALATVAWNSQVGDVFLVKATAYKGNATSTVIKTHTGITIDNITKTDDEWTYEAYGVATSTQSIIRLQVNGADGVYGYFDNVSVTNVSSDFDFDRASSATRINSSGLVQDMQSITDPELVLNGDFEDLGDETTPASDFSTSNFENNPSSGSVSESNGTLTFSNSTSSGTQVQLKNRSISDNNTYKITFTLSDFTSGTFRMSVGNQLTNHVNYNDSGAEGTHTFYVTKTGGNNRNYFYTGGTSVVVSNISVKEVDPNDRWNVGTGWSIEDGVAKFNDTIASTDAVLRQDNLTLTNGNTYELSFNVSNTSGTGEIKFQATGGGTDSIEGYEVYSGVNTLYFTPTANRTTLKIFGRDTYGSFTIDNISVKDITFSTDVDLARINYDSNGENGHILLEPTSTNLLTYSEDFDNSYWNTPNTTVETASITSPDGSNDTYKLFADTGSSSHYFDNINYSGASSGQTYTYSVFVKSAGSDFIQLASSSGFPARYQNFNLSTGAKASGDISNATIEAYPNGWYRISVTETTNSTSRRFLIVPVLTDNSRNPVFVGNAQEDGVYIFGAQLEELSYATSYIPTNGSTVTRDAETCTGAGEAVDFNSSEGVLYIETAALANSGTFRLISISDGTLNNEVTLYYRNNDDRITARLRSGSGSQVIFESFNLTATNFSKVAFRYKGGESNVFIDGVKQKASDYATTSMPVGLNSLQLSEGQPGNLPFYGKCKAIRVYKEALSDSELTTLTS